MPCFHPLDAFQCSDGSVVFREARGFDVVRSIRLPCGQCIGCRLERSRQWAMRCVHEASLCSSNCFLTLTYRPESLPERGSLDYSHFQSFMRRFRKAVSPTRPRFYMCGEYGDQGNQPHYHACIFGYDFPDRTVWKRTSSGFVLFRSPLLERLWPHGFSSIGELNFESAAYTARYVMKKINGRRAEDHYMRVDPETGELYSVVPEFTHMSLKPGIGSAWLSKFMADVFPHDYVVINGRKVKPPKYYDKKFSELRPLEMESIKFQRELDAALQAFDNTPERLAVKEFCAKSALSRLKRSTF